MSDISFLLLAFFLMVSNINSDMGIARKLPPPLPENVDPPEVRERNIFVVMVNKDDRLLFNTEYGRIEDLKDRAKEFLGNPNNDPEMPEKLTQEIPLLGSMQISKGVISLQNDRGTSYQAYIAVQNELVKAVNEIRDDFSRAQYGKVFANLNEDQQKIVKEAIPQNISEAEPKDVTKK